MIIQLTIHAMIWWMTRIELVDQRFNSIEKKCTAATVDLQTDASAEYRALIVFFTIAVQIRTDFSLIWSKIACVRPSKPECEQALSMCRQDGDSSTCQSMNSEWVKSLADVLSSLHLLLPSKRCSVNDLAMTSLQKNIMICTSSPCWSTSQSAYGLPLVPDSMSIMPTSFFAFTKKRDEGRWRMRNGIYWNFIVI